MEKQMQVTAEQVKATALAANLTEVENCRCSLCGTMTRYLIIDGELFFDSNCSCGCAYEPPQPRTWQDAAWLINRQSETIAPVIAARFGFPASGGTEQ
jgi:hypothetical protein